MRLRGAFAVLPMSALVMSLTACLFEKDVQEPDPLLVDGEYVPVLPVSPPGWPAIMWPAGNPYSPAKAILGRRLFFDARLSRSNDRACAWCHAPGASFTDPRGGRFSDGVAQGKTTRNSPTVMNLAFATSFMLDGRAASLEAQALGPLFAANEMDMTEAEIIRRLSADTAYVRLFEAAFGSGSGSVTVHNVTRALATYQRTLVFRNSPWDRWQKGDSAALSAAARRGLTLFMKPQNACATCHQPPLFTDGGFHNIGLDSAPADSGRAVVTRAGADLGKFKTPTLRNIALTYPYMHDGRFMGLADVIAHYDVGGVAGSTTDERIRPLGLSAQDKDDLIAFLEALTDSSVLTAPVYLP